MADPAGEESHAQSYAVPERDDLPEENAMLELKVSVDPTSPVMLLRTIESTALSSEVMPSVPSLLIAYISEALSGRDLIATSSMSPL